MATRNHQAPIVDNGTILSTEEATALGVCPYCGLVETEGKLGATGITEVCIECSEETSEYRGQRYTITEADRANFPEGGIKLYAPE